MTIWIASVLLASLIALSKNDKIYKYTDTKIVFIGRRDFLRKTINAFISAIGLISAFITFTDHLPQYHDVFTALIYISVGHFLGSISQKDFSTETPQVSKHSLLNVFLLLVLPSIIFVPLTLVLYFTGTLSPEFAKIIFTVSTALTAYVFAAALPTIMNFLLPK